MKRAVVTSSHNRYLFLSEKYNISDSSLILWKPDFSLTANEKHNHCESLGDSVSKKDNDQATKDIHLILQNWFRDEFGKDLTVIDGCSFGIVFKSSSELLFYNLVQCYLGLIELGKTYDEIIVDGFDDPVKTFVSEWLLTEGQKKYISIKSDDNRTSTKVKVHPMLGFRDLDYNLKGSWFDSVIAYICRILQSKRKKSIFIMDSGKLEDYLIYRKNKENKKFKLLIPIRRKVWLVFGHMSFWQRINTNSTDKRIELIQKKIDINGWNQVTQIVPQALVRLALQQFIIPYWPKALNYFKYYKTLFAEFRPNAAMFFSDGTEISLIGALAAKARNISTVMMPHGIPVWGDSTIHGNSEGPFKFYSAIGYSDKQDLITSGVNKKYIINATLPWFSKPSFKISDQKEELYNHCKKKKKAMLIPLDTGFSLYITANKIHQHLLDMIEVCEKCKIDIFGIKFRTEEEAKAFGFINGKNKIFGRCINVYAGYGNLSYYFNSINMAIGSYCSATAECSIAGINYYTYHDYSIYEYNPNYYKSSKNILYIASTQDELEKNIKSNKKFRKHHDVKSLVNISSGYSKSFSELDGVFDQFISN